MAFKLNIAIPFSIHPVTLPTASPSGVFPLNDYLMKHPSPLIRTLLELATQHAISFAIYNSQLHVELPLDFDMSALSGSEFFYTCDPFQHNRVTLHITFPSLVKELFRGSYYLHLYVAGKQKTWRSEEKPPQDDNIL